MKLPILVLSFNRPDLLQICIENLISLGQNNLYVSIDGPRNSLDFQKQAAMLEFLSTINPKSTKIKIKTRPENLGCKLGVVSGIDWFFSNVTEGAILEDDCIPDGTYFEFLDKYAVELQRGYDIGMITAHNPYKQTQSSVPFVSRYSFITGWYTTRRIWEEVRSGIFLLDSPVRRNNRNTTQTISEMIFWWSAATRAKLGFYDTWDSSFSLQMWKKGYKCLVPPQNLISNIGFGPNATHTTDESATIFIEDSENQSITQNNFDSVLKDDYFKISRRHAIGPLFRVGFEIVLMGIISLRNKMRTAGSKFLGRLKLKKSDG